MLFDGTSSCYHYCYHSQEYNPPYRLRCNHLGRYMGTMQSLRVVAMQWQIVVGECMAGIKYV
jgi:hypothetical protein